MEITSYEYSQPKSPQDWARIVKYQICLENWNFELAAFKHGFGSSNTDELD